MLCENLLFTDLGIVNWIVLNNYVLCLNFL